MKISKLLNCLGILSALIFLYSGRANAQSCGLIHIGVVGSSNVKDKTLAKRLAVANAGFSASGACEAECNEIQNGPLHICTAASYIINDDSEFDADIEVDDIQPPQYRVSGWTANSGNAHPKISGPKRLTIPKIHYFCEAEIQVDCLCVLQDVPPGNGG